MDLERPRPKGHTAENGARQLTTRQPYTTPRIDPLRRDRQNNTERELPYEEDAAHRDGFRRRDKSDSRDQSLGSKDNFLGLGRGREPSCGLTWQEEVWRDTGHLT